MELQIGFRKATLSVKGGVEYLTVSVANNPLLCQTEVKTVKNVNECEALLNDAFLTLEKTQEIGHYFMSVQIDGKKVRGFDKWRTENQYVEV